MLRLMFSRRWWGTTLLLLAGIALAVRLGFWQVDRYNQNQSMSDHLAAMHASAPIILSGGQSPAGLVGMEYRSVQASGTFDFVHQVAVRNQVWVQSWGNDSGYILVAPLIFADGTAVLVDRGWIPLQDNTRAAWQQFDQTGRVTVNGLLRLPVLPGMGAEADPTLAPGVSSMDFWNLVDIPRLQLQIPNPILPIYIQQAPDPAQNGLPYRALTDPDPSEAGTNAGYAIMWFAFAVLLIGGYPVYLRKQNSGMHAAP